MKKYRLFTLLLTLTLLLGTLAPLAAAADPSTPTATGEISQIVADMHVAGKAAILADPNTNEVLYAQNIHEKLYPASITKVMTALLTLEAIERGEFTLDQQITATDTVNDRMISGASTQNIKVGEVMSLKDVLACALIPSANEACNILAVTLDGSIPAFVERMNQRAAELGCMNTHFMNPHGLHDPQHYTSAYDIYLICRQAMTIPLFRELVTSAKYTVPATNKSEARVFWDTNALITNWQKAGYLYSNATGIKTGYTPEAGYCLASAASKDGRDLIAVVLGCERAPGSTGSAGYTQFSESKRLLQWGFSNFTTQTILDASSVNIAQLPVTLSEQVNSVVLRPEGTLSVTLPKDIDPSAFERSYTTTVSSVEAPVQEGQELGTITVSYKGKDYGSLPLVANTSITRSEKLYRLDRIQKFFGQTWVRILLIAVVVLLLVLVLRLTLFRGRSSRRYGGSHYSGSRRRRY